MARWKGDTQDLEYMHAGAATDPVSEQNYYQLKNAREHKKNGYFFYYDISSYNFYI